MKSIYEELGRRLKRERLKSELTQHVLAKKVGLSRTSIANIERGYQHITVGMLVKLATTLNVSPATLLPDTRSSHAISALHTINESVLSPKDKSLMKKLVQIPDMVTRGK